MRILLIATLLMVGCSLTKHSTSGNYTSNAEFARESQEISERERLCISATLTRSNDQIAALTSASDRAANAGIRVQMVANDRDQELAECKATAEREENDLGARERAEYRKQAQEQRERNSLMSILTTSLSR